MGDKDPEGGQEEGRRGGKSEGTRPKAGEHFSKGTGEYKWYNGNPNGPRETRGTDKITTKETGTNSEHPNRDAEHHRWTRKSTRGGM